jgi:trehalose 6-phosphate phosphatase
LTGAALHSALAPLLSDPTTTAILTDFDGTLAPIVDNPASARALVGVPTVLTVLADRFGLVAVISGRPVSFLVERLAPAAGVCLIGLYGLESCAIDGTVVTSPGADEWRTVVEASVDRLTRSAPTGVSVEAKGLTATVHWRMAPELVGWVVRAVEEESVRTGLVSHSGRMSLELRPPLPVDKGSAVALLAAPFAAACYFGDDLGDLPAFAALDRARAEAGMTTVTVAVVDGESAPEVAAAADTVVYGPGAALAGLDWLARQAGGRASFPV